MSGVNSENVRNSSGTKINPATEDTLSTRASESTLSSRASEATLLNVSTSAKQDTIIANQVSSDAERDNLYVVLRALIAAIRDPVWLDIVNNAQRSILQSGSTTAVTGTLTGVTTVSNVAAWGGYSNDLATVNLSETDWGVTVRSLII